MDKLMTYFVYILKCTDNTLYTGSTNNLAQRIEHHNTSKVGAKYTRSRRPVILVYSEKFEDKSTALKRELAIKKLSRIQKLQLIKA